MMMVSNGRKRTLATAQGKSSGGRKLKIKLKKIQPKLPEDFEETCWVKLVAAIEAVHEKKSVDYSREELYNTVQDLCIHNLSANLYKRLTAVFEAHIAKLIKTLVDQTQDHAAFLSLVNEVWADHCQQVLTIRSIFLYLDRGYVKKETSVRSLWDLGLQYFRRHLETEPQVETKIVSGLLNQIERERKGEAINRDIIKSLIQMLTSLQIYHARFETLFLSNTEEFYRAESQDRMAKATVPDYLKHVETRLKEEVQRVGWYLDISTLKPLVTRVERRMIKVHVTMILEKGFDELMDDMRIADIGLMYALFKRVEALKDMRAAFSVYVRRRGMESVQDEERDKEMVQTLLDLKEKLDKMIKEAFSANEAFDRTLRDAFEHFINCRENRPAQLIAKFMDLHLRAGNKASSEDATEELLDKVMVLFRFVNGKDVFQAFYKKDLAKRLLLGKSASTDTEMRMIAKLKSECGSQFTNKLEGMFKDIEMSQDLMKRFKENEQQRGSSSDKDKDIEINVHVLTTGCWPNYPRMETLVLPAAMGEMQKKFTDFYLSQYEGRRLQWQHSLDYCLMKAQLAGSAKELSVSLFQALVLLLFDGAADDKAIPLSEIQVKAGIEDGELRRTLQSLACGKVRVLVKEPKGRDVEDGDKFLVNKEFKSNTFRVKINSIQMKETAKESKETHAKVFQDRQYQIDAAIVRIMKARKTLAHTMLISELFKQLKFPAKPNDLKKRIESLIDREYLERDAENAHMYKYLA